MNTIQLRLFEVAEVPVQSTKVAYFYGVRYEVVKEDETFIIYRTDQGSLYLYATINGESVLLATGEYGTEEDDDNPPEEEWGDDTSYYACIRMAEEFAGHLYITDYDEFVSDWEGEMIDYLWRNKRMCLAIYLAECHLY